jgi:hypothetical protein
MFSVSFNTTPVYHDSIQAHHCEKKLKKEIIKIARLLQVRNERKAELAALSRSPIVADITALLPRVSEVFW